jgi:hypothetical protein
MSPVLGAVASVMNIFESFEDRPKFTYRLEARPWVRTGLGAEIVLAGMEGKFVEETEAKGSVQPPRI